MKQIQDKSPCIISLYSLRFCLPSLLLQAVILSCGKEPLAVNTFLNCGEASF